MAYRPATGRPIVVLSRPKTVRDLIRRHLREEGKTVEHDLARWWDMKPHSAHRCMYNTARKLGPAYIEAAIEGLGLDEFDANELRLYGARDAGWNFNPKIQVS